MYHHIEETGQVHNNYNTNNQGLYHKTFLVDREDRIARTHDFRTRCSRDLKTRLALGQLATTLEWEMHRAAGSSCQTAEDVAFLHSTNVKDTDKETQIKLTRSPEKMLELDTSRMICRKM